MFKKEDILKKWELCKDTHTDMYENCTADWDFLHGVGQWDINSEKDRKTDNRPCLVLNQLLPYAKQVINDIRQANIAIRVSPVGDGANIETAEVFQGLIRNIERQSSAGMAYSTAAMNAVGAGIGWIKLRTEYSSPMSFDQEIRIERVLDFTSVMLDPASQELDGSDAEYAFIRRDLLKEEFEELYPDEDPISFEDVEEGKICLLEYYGRYYEDDKIYLITLIDGSEQVITQDQKDAIDEDGTVVYAVIDERKVSIPYIKHCIYSGADTPIEENDFPSKYIPIVPVVGNEVYINGKREFHSIINPAKDAQRVYNYLESANVEYMALQPKSPWVAPVGSFKSYKERWRDANTKNIPYLEYDIVYDKTGQVILPPPMRTDPIQGSVALMQSAQTAQANIRNAIGMPQANMGMQGNEISGIAIRNRQIEGDNATFNFVDNLSYSLTHLGRILVDMISRLYTRPMVKRILGEDGTEKTVPINQPYILNENGEQVPAKGAVDYKGIYRLGVGEYDVVCDIGASYSSRRQETADKLIELVQARPELASITGDLLFEALDLPMGKEIAKRLRSTMDATMLSDDPMGEKLQQAEMMVAELQKQIEQYDIALKAKEDDKEFNQDVKLKELQLKSEQTRNDTLKTQAEIEKMRAETNSTNLEALQALGGAVSGIAAQVQDIAQALEIMLDAKEDELSSVASDMMATGEPQVTEIEEQSA